jgi:hypothetical protein
MARLLHTTLPLIGALSGAWQALWHRTAVRYRPELHYMRGPGPKAQAKRARA